MAFRFRARPPIGEWSLDQVGDFLEIAGFDEAVRKKFRDEAVDGAVLCQINDQDLSGEPFRLPFGLRKSLLAEVAAQGRHGAARERHKTSKGVVLTKGATVQGPQLSTEALERVRRWRVDPASGRLVAREPPLSEEEVDCWQYQAEWLACPITGKAWARSDDVCIMGLALYHAPRFCSERERERRFVEEEQARRWDASRKAAMDHSGTAFEREYAVYPVLEPPPLANLPMAVTQDSGAAAADAAQLQKLKTEVSGLRGRSAAVQRQMFEGLGGGGTAGGFVGEDDVRRALEELKVEPRRDDELARKFGIYESYFGNVQVLRGELFELWPRAQSAGLSREDTVRVDASLRRIDTLENLGIPDRSRFWFVYHMMSKAAENHGKMQRALEDLEELFDRAADRADAAASGGPSAEELSEDPELGSMEVIIGPAFDIDAYNDGASGNAAKGILSAAGRGVLDMDRQYNAVNFQLFVQRADAGITREGAEASFERRLCTSRLSFYIEESHGSRVFPRNILSQLSLLFYRRNDALRLPDGRVHEARVAVCVRKAIPRILRAIVVHVFQGERSFKPRLEKGVRLYLAVHQVAIKLLATFQTSFQLIYKSVVEWIQQPFCAKSDAQWPDLEELLLGASLCSLPWPLLREAFVRKLFAQLLMGTAQMGVKATARQRAEHLFSQNQQLIDRLAFILAFFQAGPGKLPVQEMDRKYTRCAGTVPKAEREALIAAAGEGAGVSSLVELWQVLGMRVGADDSATQRHVEGFLIYVMANEAAWRSAPPPAESSEGPALPATALEQLSLIGAQACGSAAMHGARPSGGRREREAERARRLAAERAQHQGYPKLPPSGRLDGTLCYYCHRRFPSRQALFAHLRHVIDRSRFIEGHHQDHFGLRVTRAATQEAPFRCRAPNCPHGRDGAFASGAELRRHYCEMGVPGFSVEEEVERETAPVAAGAEDSGPATAMPAAPATTAAAAGADATAGTTGAPEVAAAGGTVGGEDLATCSVCLDRPPQVVMVPCGHIYACEACGKSLKTCAICRAHVSRVLRVYYSTTTAAPA